MRLKPGRPDLAAYADRFDVPAAAPGGRGPTGTWLGVTTLLLDDGESRVLTDGFFSRPSLLRVGVGRFGPDASRIEAELDRLGLLRRPGAAPTLDGVVAVHSHYDHAMDSPTVAARTGAPLVGGASTLQVGRGGGLPESQLRQVAPGETVELGAWRVTFVVSDHCPPDRYPGEITHPVVPPARVTAWRCGESWSLLVRHTSGRTALVQGSAGFVPGALDGHRAEVSWLGIGQLGIHPESFVADYWQHTVRAVGARRVVLTHWDDFFRPLDRPLRALPYAGDDLDHTMRVLTRLADRDGVTLSFPTVRRREDPWR